MSLPPMSARSPIRIDGTGVAVSARGAFDFRGRMVFVAGASGGIGSAVAVRLAQAGSSLVLHYAKRRHETESLANRCRSSGAPQVELEQADFSDRDQRQRLSTRLTARPLDGVVWAAGVDLMAHKLRPLPFHERLAHALEVDLVAPMELTRAIGATINSATMNSPSSSMVFLGWDGVTTGGATDTAQLYGAVKGGLAGFAQSLAQQLAPRVRVNTLLLGWIKTRWGDDVANSPAHPFHRVADETSLLQRWGEADDVASAILFLLSDESRYITGGTLEVNGGRKAWTPHP